jgi:hypothetical protein
MLLAAFGVCNAPSTAAADRSKSAVRTDEQRLTGRWVRPDGGYVLELKEIGKDGSLKAAYFNPRPINVSKAEWRRIGDRIQIFVELRDVNYPGSIYTLVYFPENDQLVGKYFQAVQGETYDVRFMRVK